jgi:hypothetical protein
MTTRNASVEGDEVSGNAPRRSVSSKSVVPDFKLTAFFPIVDMLNSTSWLSSNRPHKFGVCTISLVSNASLPERVRRFQRAG